MLQTFGISTPGTYDSAYFVGTAAQRQQAEALLAQGMTPRQIADAMGGRRIEGYRDIVNVSDYVLEYVHSPGVHPVYQPFDGDGDPVREFAFASSHGFQQDLSRPLLQRPTADNPQPRITQGGSGRLAGIAALAAAFLLGGRK